MSFRDPFQDIKWQPPRPRPSIVKPPGSEPRCDCGSLFEICSYPNCPLGGRDREAGRSRLLREALEAIAGGDGDAREIAQQTLTMAGERGIT